MNRNIKWGAALAALALGGCATLPSGPSATLALPGAGKTFAAFRADDAACRQYALAQVGGQTPNQVATSNTVASAAVGAVLGGLVGAAAGHDGSAAFGAATGALFGTAIGSGTAAESAYALQHHYDAAYQQCMYAKGNRVVVRAPAYRYYPYGGYPNGTPYYYAPGPYYPPVQYYYYPPPAAPSAPPAAAVPPPGTPPPANVPSD